MSKLTRKQTLWLCLVTLFGAVAFSMYAMFKGSILMLVLSAVLFVIGFFALKQYMSY
ncbi:MAG: hypothetical protein ACI32F_07010 [Allobaculum sp.]